MSRPDVKIISVDTNIVLDYLLDRKNKVGAPLGDKAWKIFKRAINGEFKIVISDWLATQVLHHVEPGALKFLFSQLKESDALIMVKSTPEDKVEARKYSKDIDDPMHAILARKGGATIIITRDLAGYDCCKSIIEAKLPESL